MANGRLGAVTPSADTDVILYTCPTDTIASITVSVARRSVDKADLVRIALIDSTLIADLVDEDYLEYDSTITSMSIVLSAGQSVSVRSNTATVSFVSYGFEEIV